MPGNSAADSYAMYSMLMPVGETVGKELLHKRWLVRDTAQGIYFSERTL